MPGCEYEQIYYDKAGRMVATQDGNQRLDQKWLLHLYDQYGRETVNALSAFYPIAFPFITVQTTPSTDGLGFTSNININASDVLSVNYYDDYNFLNIFTSVKDSIKYRDKAGYDTAWDYGCGNDTVSSHGMLTGMATRILDTDTLLLRTIYYDSHENVIQTHEMNLKGGYEHYYYDLSFTGKPLKIRHEHTTADTALVETTTFTYDNMERLLTVSLTQDDGSPQLLCSNTYDELGRLATQGLGGSSQGGSASFAHQTDYTYNVRGWLSGISGTKFSQTLHYEDAGSTGATPCFNGNISAMEWTAQETLFTSSPTAQRYAYSYDGLNRLTSAVYGTTSASSINGFLVIYNNEPRNYSCTYQYDLNGNITALTRKGVSMTTTVSPYVVWAFDDIDDLTITYNGNQLKKVTDQCDELTYEGAMDFRDGANKGTEYSWDANGNITSDKNRRIHKIIYNVLNLPRKITFNDGNIIQHTYAADGRRLRTEYLLSNMQIMEREGIGDGLTPMSGGIAGGDSPDFLGPGIPIDPINPIDDNTVTTLTKREYCGNHIYRNDSLERVLNDYGYRNATGYHYYVNDYQGNVRAVVDGSGTLKEVNSYYPYGALMGGGIAAGVQPYKYGGKELDRQAGIDWYDNHARWYDSLIGQTPTQDRLAEKYYHLSPYAWCAGNPIGFIDPSGMNPIYDFSGSFLGQTNEGFSGQIYVFLGTSTLDNISNMSVDDAINTYGIMPMDDFSLNQDCSEDNPLLLSNQSKSNIITNIISHFEKEQVFEKTFSMKSLENEKIDIKDIGFGKNWTTNYHTLNKTKPIKIVGSGTFQTDYEGTVENIAATVLYHEWYGHGMHHLSDENKNHHKAYWCVMQSPLWEATTEKYKEYVKNQYNNYLLKERGIR
ncbi:MAG: hypothetical protein J6S96_03575 [Muribaculaceae bacterium]|nr:hypothetical protein [Muribaculaceae bacterium]